MKSYEEILEFNKIKQQLADHALTENAIQKCLSLEPLMEERRLKKELKETTEARQILDEVGAPPMTAMKDLELCLHIAEEGGMLLPSQLENIGSCLSGIRRLKDFLNRCKTGNWTVAYYGEDLSPLEDLRIQITSSIRGNEVDDNATAFLREIRHSIDLLQSKIKDKAETLLRTHKASCSDSFVTTRNGRFCLPVKKEYRFKVDGSVIDQSSTGGTLFIEPYAVSKLTDELAVRKLDEENEERNILYTLTATVAESAATLRQNLSTTATLDFIFAKGKLSAEMDAVLPAIASDRHIIISKGRHPLLSKEDCVPLDFEAGQDKRGVVITGPNTGGKTVALKTVGLFCCMAQCGLHLPCEDALISMNSRLLCDIGDGQNISENLSTFSAHIKTVLEILKLVNKDSLVLLDELGSGTDPTEGMGIAVAILEKLRESGCLFVATTHYPEVKTYAEQTEAIVNARMSFDRHTLKPLYKLEIGKAGESCALYIAARLGLPTSMQKCALKAAYGESGSQEIMEVPELIPAPGKKIVREEKSVLTGLQNTSKFQRGDSVSVSPDQKTGIVCQPANEHGMVLLQLKKEKILVSHKRLKLLVAASSLYPEDYDFSIVFDSVAVRKARHQMDRKYSPDLIIKE